MGWQGNIRILPKASSLFITRIERDIQPSITCSIIVVCLYSPPLWVTQLDSDSVTLLDAGKIILKWIRQVWYTALSSGTWCWLLMAKPILIGWGLILAAWYLRHAGYWCSIFWLSLASPTWMHSMSQLLFIHYYISLWVHLYMTLRKSGEIFFLVSFLVCVSFLTLCNLISSSYIMYLLTTSFHITKHVFKTPIQAPLML